jgi:hypothetical protein
MRASEFLAEQASAPTTAYHITGLENAEEIMYGGLRPHDGKAFLIVDTGDKKKLHKEIDQVYGWMSAKAHNRDEELTLLQVDITDIPLTYEFGWNFATSTIPANRIKDLGPDTLARYI